MDRVDLAKRLLMSNVLMRLMSGDLEAWIQNNPFAWTKLLEYSGTAIAYFQERAKSDAEVRDAALGILPFMVCKYEACDCTGYRLWAALGKPKCEEHSCTEEHKVLAAKHEALAKIAREVAADIDGLAKALWTGKTKPHDLRFAFFDEAAAKLREHLPPSSSEALK